MVKGKLLAGPIIAVIGGSVMLIAAFMVFGSKVLIDVQLASGGLTWQDVGFDPNLYFVRVACTALWGILGIIGAILGFIGKKFGGILALLGGILGIAGWFIPLGTITLGIPVLVSLSASFLFVDPILMLVGGILILALSRTWIFNL